MRKDGIYLSYWFNGREYAITSVMAPTVLAGVDSVMDGLVDAARRAPAKFLSTMSNTLVKQQAEKILREQAEKEEQEKQEAEEMKRALRAATCPPEEEGE